MTGSLCWSLYKEVPIVTRINNILTNQFTVDIYSGTRKLTMLIDTGAEYCAIGSTVLKGCSYHNVRQRTYLSGVNGIFAGRTVMFDFDMESLKDEYPFSIDFNVLSKKVSPYFNSGDLSGVLGSNFLRYCDTDLIHGVLRIYRPQMEE